MQLNPDLNRHLQEITCLYEISNIETKAEVCLGNVLDTAIALLLPALPQSELAGVLIENEEIKRNTERYRQTEWSYDTPVLVEEKQVAHLRVCYLECPSEDPFPDEVCRFIRMVARHIGGLVKDFESNHQLAESEQFFRKIVEMMAEGLSKVDLDDRFVFANSTAEEIFEVGPGGLVGHTLSDFLDPNDLEIISHQSTLRGRGETSVYDLRITTEMGNFKDLLVTAAPDLNAAGEQIGTIGIYRDMTDRQALQKSLIESEARFRSLFDNAPISLWEEDFSGVKLRLDTLAADGVSDLRAHLNARPEEVIHCAGMVKIVDINRATLELFHAPDKEYILGNLDKLFVEDSFQVFLEEIVTLHEGNTTFESVLTGRAIDGELVDCSIRVGIAPGYEESWTKVFVSVLDLSEEKRKEAALRESEERFRRIFEEAPLGVTMIGMDRSFISVNGRFCEILGYTEEELMKITFVDITHPEDRAESIRRAEALASGDSDRIRMEKRYLKKDGTIIWGRLSALIVRDPSGTALHFLSMLEDVTEHRQTVDALHVSKERYSQAQRAGNIGSCDWNLQSGEVFWSENIDRIFGFEPEKFGRTFDAFVGCIHPEDRARVQDTMRRSIKGDSTFRVEHRIVWPDGTVRWVLEVGDIERNQDGRAFHIFGIIQDITDRHRAETTLRQSEQYYRTFFESAHGPVILFSPDDEVVIDVNQRACELYGYNRSEFVGLDLKSISKDVGFGEQQVDTLLSQGTIGTFETVQFRSDGSPLNLEVSASILEFEGSPAVLSINRDISDRKMAAEELLKAKESAEAANLAKSAFLAHMSHEIRTPLNAIVGMTELTLDTDLDSQQREFLQTSGSAAEHLLALVNDILDLSKIEAGRVELENRVFSLHDLLDKIVAALSSRAVKAGLDLSFDLRPGVPDTFSGDAGRLRQVLYNLVNNAIKFTESGTIELVVSLVDMIDDEVFLRFAVSDTGIGISPENLESIFDTFSQADESTTRLYGGTGLGLAISKSLVELMGGEIWAESVEGSGSTFRFTSRLKTAQVEQAIVQKHEEQPTSEPSRPLRILLAEDFPANQKVVAALLEKRGYEVVIAENGQLALNAFQKQSFDVILMDIEMPVMDGIDATVAIRKIESEGDSRIPIIALTAHALKGMQERLTGIGMDLVLTKPVRKATLYAAIDRITSV